MQFLYPQFLYALFLTAIPVIIHLFNFRKQKVIYYSNVDFLKQVKLENKAVRQLKNILTLLMRMAAIVSLVLIFAGPYMPPEGADNKQKEKIVALYIDNSFSTEAEGVNGKLSELAKSKAFEITEAYSEHTQFLFLNNDFEAKHQHFTSKIQIQDFIYETDISGYVRPISEVLEKVKSFKSESGKNDKLIDLYLISDFQKTTTDIKF